ncbi:MAG: EF-hand domain-containing protein [Epsilonproteobacteria bacterium]|nr:EF-hand domain-containing protein [Campylobacterota bacterium]
MKKIGVLLALIGLLNAADTTRGPVAFESYDTNKDNIITQEEFQGVKNERMSAKAEANMPMRNASNTPEFGFFDTNKDGKITKDEYQKGQLERMQDRRGKGRQ